MHEAVSSPETIEVGKSRFVYRGHAIAAVAMSGLVAFFICSPAPPRPLADSCYSDVTCLTEAATTNIGAVDRKRLPGYATSLARLGRFDLARSAAQEIDHSEPLNRTAWQNTLDEIAIREVAFQANANADSVASFAPLQALDKREHEGRCFDTIPCSVLVDCLVYRSPWGPMDSAVSEVFRPKMARQANATLKEVLTVLWPAAIRTLPSNKQGWEWNELAKAWLELGDFRQSEMNIDHAEKVGLEDFEGVQRVFDATWRTWLALGRNDRAASAIDRVSDKPFAAQFRLVLAEYLLKAGRREEALALITAALPDIRLDRPQKLDFLRLAVDIRIEAGDLHGARSVADEVAVLAHQRDFVPAANLALAAMTFNDLGDHDRAVALLEEARAKVPPKTQSIGVSLILGPLTGDSMGLDDSLRSEIATEAYRADDREMFDELMRETGAYYQARTWQALCEPRKPISAVPPTDEACLSGGGPGFLVRHAIQSIAAGHTASADGDLGKALSSWSSQSSMQAVAELMNVARVAVADGSLDLVQGALVHAAQVADRLPSRGDREDGLAEVAALRSELLSTSAR